MSDGTTVTLTDRELAYVREGLANLAAEKERQAERSGASEAPDWDYADARTREATEVRELDDRLGQVPGAEAARERLRAEVAAAIAAADDQLGGNAGPRTRQVAAAARYIPRSPSAATKGQEHGR